MGEHRNNIKTFLMELMYLYFHRKKKENRSKLSKLTNRSQTKLSTPPQPRVCICSRLSDSGEIPKVKGTRKVGGAGKGKRLEKG